VTPSLEPFAHYCGLRRSPRILLVGEGWGQSEDLLQAPFVGHSGKELFRMLGDARVAPGPKYDAVKRVLYASDELFLAKREEWLRDAGIGLTNVFALRPLGNKLEALCGPEGKGVAFGGRTLPPLVRSPRHLYMRPEFCPQLARLRDEVRVAGPNLVIALGAAALWGLSAALGLPQVQGGLTETRGTVMDFKINGILP